MTIRIEKLYKQARQNYQMQLLSGGGGLGNIVNWVHMIEDEQVADFLRGNELVFTTGIGHTENTWLKGFAQGLTRNKASGLVVNIGPYINEVPDDVIEYCQQENLPLFTIPWQIRLVDVSRDFCRRIISSEQTDMGLSSAFKNAIYFPSDLSKYQAQLERHGFNGGSSYCVAVIAVYSEQESRQVDNLAKVRLYAENIINRFSDKYSIFMQDKCLTIIFANFTDNDIAICIDSILECNRIVRRDYNLIIGIGQNENGLSLITKSYRQAASVLHMAVKSNSVKVYYKDLGIYKLLLSAEDDNILREMYNEILGRLADYDVTNGTDYMSTLKIYLENDASVQAVARLTFVHRNTINYKLKKIRDITGCDVTSIEDRLKIMLAFKIKDIL